VIPASSDVRDLGDSVLELQDPRSEVAVFEKRQKVRFLQDNIIAYQNYDWGDGNILADYKCSPGVPLDQYQDGFRYNILISLRETKNKITRTLRSTKPEASLNINAIALADHLLHPWV
jgi:hypothetical protein